MPKLKEYRQGDAPQFPITAEDENDELIDFSSGWECDISVLKPDSNVILLEKNITDTINDGKAFNAVISEAETLALPVGTLIIYAKLTNTGATPPTSDTNSERWILKERVITI